MFKKIITFFLFNSLIYAVEQQSAGSSSSTSSKQTTNQYVGSCYSYVRTIIDEGKEDTSLGAIKSMYGGCTQNVSITGIQKNFKDSKTFISFLTENRYPSFNNELKFDLSKCENQKNPPVHEIASRYYYLLSRIDKGQQSLVQQLSSLSVALGDNQFIKQLGCENSEFSDIKKICKDAQTCNYKNSIIPDLAETTDKTLKQISDLEKELKNINLSLGRSKTSMDDRARMQEQAQWIKLQIASLKDLIPWARGDVFMNAKLARKSTAEAIQNQLKEDRKTLLKTFNESQKVKRCLITKPQRSDSCDAGEITDIADYTPAISTNLNLPKNSNVDFQQKAAYASLEVGAQQCIFNGRVEQIKTSKIINESLLQAGFTAATLGLGSAASVGRFLASRALTTEKVASNIVAGLNVAREGVNGAAFLKDVKDVADVCTKFASYNPKLRSQNSCESENVMESFTANKAYSDCVLAASMAAFSGGTFVAGKLLSLLKEGKVSQLDIESQKKLASFLSSFESGDKVKTLKAASELDNLARFKAAEKALGKELTLTQKRAVLKAHSIGGEKGFFEYTEDELREKMKVLVRSGISRSDADKIMRSGITGKFSGENAKLAEEGLLEGQMRERNTIENLKSYEEDFRSQSFSRSEIDKKLTAANKEIELTERKLKDPKLTDTDRTSLEAKLEDLNKTRSEAFKQFTGGNNSISENITDTRGSIIRRTDEIDRIRSSSYERTGKSLTSKNPQLADRLTTRQKLFETEGFLEVQKNSGDPSSAISAFRRATKDLNEIQSMGYGPTKSNEAIRNIKLRAVAQDLKGVTGAEMEKVVTGKVGQLEKGVELISGDFSPTKTLPILENNKFDKSIWDAYVKLSQRKADQYIVSDLLENPSFLRSNGISSNAAEKISDIYVANKEVAEAQLKEIIQKVYANNPNQAKEVLKALLGW